MSKVEEEDFLIGCFTQLKKYPEHNQDELDYLLSVLKYRKESLEQSIVAKSKCNKPSKC